jgi:ribonuclease III
MCRIQFVRESLPQGLLPPPTERGRLSTPYGCVKMMELKKYLFQMLLGIQTMHLFPQTVFGDPSCATGDVDDYCSDMHLIPRFVSVSDPPLLNKDDLMAPHRIGFAVGKFLPLEHVLGCLGATSNCRVDNFLKMNPPKVIVDAIVSTRIQGVPCVFRVDSLVYEEPHDAPPPVDTNSTSTNDTESSQEKKEPQLRRLRHLGQGAIEYDGVESKKRLRKWQEVGRLVQVSPRVDAHTELLDPEQCHLTGLRADVFEVASAMPMVLKYMRHYKLLASFEVDMHLAFRDKTLLRQAFTHGSYVDAAMQSVNTVEATISRVRLGHVFENTASLKRDRSAAFRAGESKMDPEVKRVTEQHLASDFKPEFHSKYLCPYERLEFLGDAVLSFLVATSSFLKLPHSDGESVLHDTRKEITNNAALGRVALAANFETLMLTAYDLQQLALDKTSKIAADCMEALLGAVYTDQGMDACRRLLLELMARYAPDVREKYLLEMDEIVARAAAYTALDRDRFAQSPKVDEMREAHRKFTKKTNVVIRNPHLWLQAVTHGSFKAPQIDDDEFLCTDPSYERIEFLGDAVLQLLSSEFLVDALPHYQEHLLTQARSSLVKNTRLAQVAKDAGYHDFIRLGNLVKQNMTTTTNALYTEDVLADVFEATLGAVFLENPRDLEKARSILTHTLFPLLTQAIRRREWMNPEKILSHYLTDWGRGANKRIDCAFRTLGSQHGNEHCVALYINRFRVAHGSGRTIQEAKNRACKQALYLYGIGLAT